MLKPNEFCFCVCVCVMCVCVMCVCVCVLHVHTCCLFVVRPGVAVLGSQRAVSGELCEDVYREPRPSGLLLLQVSKDRHSCWPGSLY